MKKLKKIQLNLGKEHWIKKYANMDRDPCNPINNSLFNFLLNREFSEVPELHMKHHTLITWDLTSYWRIRSAVHQTRKQV